MGEFAARPTTCHDCGCAILWLRNEMTGSVSPIELLPVEGALGGIIETDIERGTYRVAAQRRFGLVANHRTRCPMPSYPAPVPPAERRGEPPGRCGT